MTKNEAQISNQQKTEKSEPKKAYARPQVVKQAKVETATQGVRNPSCIVDV